MKKGTDISHSQNEFGGYAVWENRLWDVHSSEEPDLNPLFQETYVDSITHFPMVAQREVLKNQAHDMRQIFSAGKYTLEIYKQDGETGYVLSNQERGKTISKGSAVSRGAKELVRKSVGLRGLLFAPQMIARSF
jgi:hypothetical protein